VAQTILKTLIPRILTIDHFICAYFMNLVFIIMLNILAQINFTILNTTFLTLKETFLFQQTLNFHGIRR